MTTFYTYLWLREDGTPYYVGKGCRNRAFNPHRFGNPPPRERIIVQGFADEASAFAAEIFLISFFGREDLKEGTLINLTDGGDGPVGKIISTETRKKLSARAKGNKFGWEKGRKRSDENRQKIRRAQLGIPRRLETVLKMSASKKGKPWSEARRLAQTSKCRA